MSGHAVAPAISDMNSRLLTAAPQALRTRALYLHTPWLAFQNRRGPTPACWRRGRDYRSLRTAT
jgi:hypothetical protein